ncbi:hypothetical protein V6R21_24115 [Limibacter armeniacum]|uniref:hypothetical protein n=1 Tax=Limibacter armeniacum TaxID=466084 RepID=UPI002FE6678A
MKNFKSWLLATTCVCMFSCADNANDDSNDLLRTQTVAPERLAERRAQLYVTNNADGNITIYDLTNETSKSIATSSTAAEGIHYDAALDLVTQASRSNLQLASYANVSSLMDGDSPAPALTSSADLESPRELAVLEDKYVVSDNGSNKFFVYTKSGDNYSLTNTFDIPFNVWGITFKGTDLYAVVDNSSDLAVFYDFFSNTTDGLLRPSKRVTIEGIIRTHGLTYSGSDDVMIMTDIGDAANATDDGGFHVIPNFSEKFDALSDGEALSVLDQTRVAGPATMLGNPIDVAYDAVTDAIYISEIGNGKVVGFTNIGDGGNLTPTFIADLPAASSIQFSSEETDGDIGESSTDFRSEMFVTVTFNSDVTYYDFVNNLSKSITTASAASEGIYYSGSTDGIIQASRANNRLEFYSPFTTVSDSSTVAPNFVSNPDLPSPREIAVFGNKVVVADNGNNQFFVYSYDGTSFSLTNTFDIPFNVWGITFMGNDLLAVVDNTSDLAVFQNFFANTMSGAIMPDKQITIEGIVRTHGITFSASDDILIMTDIGAASNTTDDGGFHVIYDFTSKLAALETGATLPMTDQVRVAGPKTKLGNPIDVAYDNRSKRIYISEVGNGKVLGFSDYEMGGDLHPRFTDTQKAASSIYFYSN